MLTKGQAADPSKENDVTSLSSLPPAWMTRSIATLAFLGASARASAADYQLGQGLPVGDFLFSGYLNVEAVAPQSDVSKLTLDDVSLFVAGRVNRWINPFAEVEISSDTLAQQGGGPMVDGHFVHERI